MDIEIQLCDLIVDWLHENNIEHKFWFRPIYDDQPATITGFGWGVILSRQDIQFSNQLNHEIATLTIADPTTLDILKSKILDVESRVMNVIIDSVKEKEELRGCSSIGRAPASHAGDAGSNPVDSTSI